MNDRDLVWVTDKDLNVTSLSARLRDVLGLEGTRESLHASELWGSDPFSIAVVAHRWALEGESVDFETTVSDRNLHVRLEPMTAPNGQIAGVAGRASENDLESRSRLEALAQAEGQSGVGSWHRDLRSGRVTISDGLGALLGIAPGVELIDIRAFDHPEDRETVARCVRMGEIGGEGYSCEHRISRADGQLRYVREHVRTSYDADGTAVAQIGTLLDITTHKLREAQLEHLAHYDALTRLPNRALLEERLAQAIAGCNDGESRVAVMFIDLDDFKGVNDRYGHGVGDALLRLVGNRFARHVRSSDIVARPSGDEFVIVMEDIPSPEAALDAARKILAGLDEPFAVDGKSIRINASIGVAMTPDFGPDPAAIVAAADREMYIVKRNGGRGVKLALAGKETVMRIPEKMACSKRSLTDLPRFAILKNA
jgi:diguanylate cyclase (GGDEF)-like protein/PAS domain S-box-containing protein